MSETEAKPASVNPLGAFKDADFDPSAWVNAHIDQRVSMLPRLQMLAQDLNEKLERNMSLILSSLPRVSADCERLKSDSAALQPLLSTLEDKVVELSPRTGAQEPLEMLGHLSTIKGNLELCCSTLFEAASWHRLVRQVESNFATRNLSSVAARLGDMRKRYVIRISLWILFLNIVPPGRRPEYEAADGVSAVGWFVHAGVGALDITVYCMASCRALSCVVRQATTETNK
jgi:hypothetical protein